MEEWRSIPGYPLFEASDAGRIRRVTHEIVTIDQGARPRDYPRVRITGRHADRLNTRRLDARGRVLPSERLVATPYRRVLVHVLVARAFIGECPPGYEHNHKDGNKRNARPDNLEFVTHSQNQKHSYGTLGRAKMNGSKHPMAKLTESDVVTIRTMHARGFEGKAIALRFAVSESTVSMIVLGKIWRHILPSEMPPVR